jgi:hypothetical protein
MPYILLLERDIVAFLQSLHQIKLGPENMAKPPVVHLSSGAQSESEKPLSKLDKDF